MRPDIEGFMVSLQWSMEDINHKIPLPPPFPKGDFHFPLFGKEGLGEI